MLKTSLNALSTAMSAWGASPWSLGLTTIWSTALARPVSDEAAMPLTMASGTPSELRSAM